MALIVYCGQGKKPKARRGVGVSARDSMELRNDPRGLFFLSARSLVSILILSRCFWCWCLYADQRSDFLSLPPFFYAFTCPTSTARQNHPPCSSTVLELVGVHQWRLQRRPDTQWFVNSPCMWIISNLLSYSFIKFTDLIFAMSYISLRQCLHEDIHVTSI